MAKRRRPRSLDTARTFSITDPSDPVGNVVAIGVVEGGAWLFGRILDRLRGRQAPMDPNSLPLATSESSAPSGNVRISQPPSGQ